MTDTFTCWRDPSHPVAPHPDFGWPRCTVCGAAPQYYDRYQYLPEHFSVGIYLPNPETPFHALIEPASAMVGIEAGEGRTLVYFEGWKQFLPTNLKDHEPYAIWHEALVVATSRMITAYPTIACATPRNIEIHRVGTFWPVSKVFDVAEAYRDELNDWMSSTRHYTKESQ